VIELRRVIENISTASVTYAYLRDKKMRDGLIFRCTCSHCIDSETFLSFLNRGGSIKMRHFAVREFFSVLMGRVLVFDDHDHYPKQLEVPASLITWIYRAFNRSRRHVNGCNCLRGNVLKVRPSMVSS